MRAPFLNFHFSFLKLVCMLRDLIFPTASRSLDKQRSSDSMARSSSHLHRLDVRRLHGRQRV